ncbi:MAG: excinuclease ABC subunit UvrA [Akkermansiaceae bacterium]
MDVISIKGARQHNLDNIDVEIPRGKLVVITGPSGSGKSSLAFHTLYAEGQRRYVESLSAYARQFLHQLEKPDVDAIEGLSPAIAIEQRNGVMNPRSTIATATEIYDYLRILYASAGIPHDPSTGQRLVKMTSEDIVTSLSSCAEGSKLVILAPIPREEAADLSSLISNLQRQGFVRLRVNNEIRELDDAESSWPTELRNIEVVIDRLVARDGFRGRLADSVEAALRICGSQLSCLVKEPEDDDFSELSFSTSYRNPETGYVLPALSPKHFSFNSSLGACPKCHGLGTELSCSHELLVPDAEISIAQGAIVMWKSNKRKKSLQDRLIRELASEMGVSDEVPFRELPDGFKQILFYGDKAEGFEGLCHKAERLARESKSNAVRRSMGRFLLASPCKRCNGRRLMPEILSVKLECSDGSMLGIDEFCALSVEAGLSWMNTVSLPQGREHALSGVMDEILRRLRFLDEVGLAYLTLDRASNSLSGGEAQRIRLATQIGAGLSGVIYVLDEPSIGLHSADNARLINALVRLRDIGNTVVVVEHDEEMIRAADWLIDIGPGAGVHGGRLLASGTPDLVMRDDKSVTGRWLSGQAGKVKWASHTERSGEILIKNAQENNLQGVDVTIPLGMLVAITGPSGSGKSTLVDRILRRALARHFHHALDTPGAHDGIEGKEHLSKVIVVDQKPLGRSPRSNPATYTGALDLIRALFAKLPLSRQRGYDAGRFSFNVKGGRCEKCQGDGAIRLDMHFLNDAYITCDACSGKRYNRETLEVSYKGHNIAEVLDMTAEQAARFFQNVPKLSRVLNALCDVGLGYIHLGQPANTLSGGEAQRVKLAYELSKPNTGHCLYLLDEPTTGLHYEDVQVLLNVLFKLRDAGNSLVIIEHNLDVMTAADWIIDLGPGGGRHGGKVVAEGTPAQIALSGSLTGNYLKAKLKENALHEA